MKEISTLYLLILSGCVFASSNTITPPTGEEVFDALFKATNIDLKEEPLCQMRSITRNKESITLGEHISTLLSGSYDNSNITKITSKCELSKHEFNNGKVIDAWDCSFQVTEENSKGEYIASSTIAFNLSTDKKNFLKKSLRCL